MLAVGSRQPGGSSQCWLPTNWCVWVQVVLEKLFLQTRNHICSVKAARLWLTCPLWGSVASPWPAVLWRPPVRWWTWWALVPQLSPHHAHCTQSWAEKPNPEQRISGKKTETWRRHSGCDRRRGKELSTLCGSAELKLLQSRKYGSSATTS